MNDLVSVIVPVYKVEAYFDRCVESIVNQTYRNLDIILVDDGSPDNCPQMCDAWAQRDNRIKVIHKKNAGLGMARNSGLEIANGDFLMFIDSDDWVHQNMVEVLLQRMKQDESDMAICKYSYAWPDGRIVDVTGLNWREDKIEKSERLFTFHGTRDWPVEAWNKMYRKEVFESIRYPRLKCAEDLWVYPHLISQCRTVSLVNQSLVFYTQRESSIIHTMSYEQRMDELKAILHMVQETKSRGYEESAVLWFEKALFHAFRILSAPNKAVECVNCCLSAKEKQELMGKVSIKGKIKWALLHVPIAFKAFNYAKGRKAAQ